MLQGVWPTGRLRISDHEVLRAKHVQKETVKATWQFAANEITVDKLANLVSKVGTVVDAAPSPGVSARGQLAKSIERAEVCRLMNKLDKASWQRNNNVAILYLKELLRYQCRNEGDPLERSFAEQLLLEYMLPGSTNLFEDPPEYHLLQAAELYVHVKKKVEGERPINHWDWYGSFYFSATLLYAGPLFLFF